MDNQKNTEIQYNIDYRDIKYPRLEFKTGSLLLVLPKNYQKQTTLLEKHKKWIQTKNQTINTALQQATTKTLNQTRTTRQLKTLVNTIAQKIQKEHNFKINKIIYRKMKTKWASHSQKNNLTINTLLKHLPQKLIEYVIFHEMTHTKQRKHNQTFWNTIAKKYPNHQTQEKNLLIYWFLVQEILTKTTLNNKKQEKATKSCEK